MLHILIIEYSIKSIYLIIPWSWYIIFRHHKSILKITFPLRLLSSLVKCWGKLITPRRRNDIFLFHFYSSSSHWAWTFAIRQFLWGISVVITWSWKIIFLILESRLFFKMMCNCFLTERRGNHILSWRRNWIFFFPFNSACTHRMCIVAERLFLNVVDSISIRTWCLSSQFSEIYSSTYSKWSSMCFSHFHWKRIHY